jgi:hypothetical protein
MYVALLPAWIVGKPVEYGVKNPGFVRPIRLINLKIVSATLNNVFIVKWWRPIGETLRQYALGETTNP